MSMTAGEDSATSGPFSVQVFGCKQHLRGGRTCYVVRVVGADGEHWLRRQFQDFADLRDSLGDRSEELPTMPRRSLLRQRLSPSFRKSRHMELRDIAVAAVSTDPLAVTPGVRAFLGLRAMTSEQAASMEEFQRFLLLTRLSFRPIDESDEDDGSSTSSTVASSWEDESSDTDLGSRPVRALNRIFDEGSEEHEVFYDKLVVAAKHYFFFQQS